MTNVIRIILELNFAIISKPSLNFLNAICDISQMKNKLISSKKL